MDSLAIEIFVKVAEERNFVAAGKIIGISASGIGKSVGRLEETLGVRLFHRSTRSVALTAEGKMFLERARRILNELAAARAELSQTVSRPTGRLRVSLPVISEHFLLPLAAFQKRYPQVELDLDFDNRYVDVIDEGYDVVLRSGSMNDSRLTARLLGSFQTILVGAPSYFKRRGTPMHPRDLLEHNCIQFRMTNTGRLQTWQLHRNSGDSEICLGPSITCNTDEARRCFALEGVGIAYMADFTVNEQLQTGALVQILGKYTFERNTFHLLWPSGKHMMPKLRAFIDFMTTNCPLSNLSP